MPRRLAALALFPVALFPIALGLGGAAAEPSRPVPVESDLRRYQRLDDRIESRGTGSLGIDRESGYGPYAPVGGVAAPHVPGFGGPPGSTLRDTVGNSGPLPPGSPVNVGNE